MKKLSLILLLSLITCILLVRVFAETEVVEMKKAVMIIASDGFRDEELLYPKEILEKNGVAVTIASTSTDGAKGMLGANIKPDILLRDIKAADFDAVIFVGGMGASQYWDDSVAHQLAKEAFESGRVIAAICIAPVTLSRAGILKNKRATVFSSEVNELKAGGAKYSGKAVEVDGNIITASGPQAAREFGEELVKAIKSK